MSTPDITRSTNDSFSDSEDELDWEEVAVPQAQHLELEDQAGPSTRPNIEVTLDAHHTKRKGDKQYAFFLCLPDGHFEAVLQEEVSWWHLAC